jgi:hypothetical protein
MDEYLQNEEETSFKDEHYNKMDEGILYSIACIGDKNVILRKKCLFFHQFLMVPENVSFVV